MDILSVVVTLAIFAILIIAIIKKCNIVVVLLFLTLIGYFFATIISGTSTLPEASSSGNMWIDIFQQFDVSFASTLAGTGLIIMVVLGYSEYMSKIKASEMFASIVSIPISKIKAKYILIGITPLIGLLYMLVIPSAMSAFVVALGTLYPILVIAGINPLTAAVAILLGCNIFCGPANPFVLMMLKQMELSDTLGVAAFFIQYALPVAIVMEIVMGIVFVFWSKFLDSRIKPVESPIDYEALDINSLGVPKFYAIFPVLPLIFIIVFSSFVVKSIIISVVAAQVISLCIVVLVHILCTNKGERKKAFNDVNEFFKAMGQSFGSVVAVVAVATFLAGAITKLGGMTVIIRLLVENLGLGFWPMLFVLLAIFFVMSFTAGPAAAIPVIGPAIFGVATSTGSLELLPMACLILVMGGGLGLMIKPFDPKLVMMSEMYKIDVIQCIKYTIVPAFAGVATVVAMSVILYG